MKSAILSILFCSVFITMTSAQDFEWARGMGGNKFEYAQDVVVDAMGNVYTAGTFLDTGDFDPGPGTTLLYTPTSYEGLFVQKFDPSGNLLWAKSVANIRVYQDEISLTVDNHQNVYVTGGFRTVCDFDPGPGVFNLSFTGIYSSAFLLKLNSSGDFVWARQFEGNHDRKVNSLKTDTSGNLYVFGMFRDSIDLDLGVSQLPFVSPSSQDIFVAKYDSNANLIWAHTSNSPWDEGSLTISLSSTAVYLLGRFESATEFILEQDTVHISSPGLYIIKMDFDAHPIWAKNLVNIHSSQLGDIMALTPDGYIYVGAIYDGLVDFDPGAGVDTSSSFHTAPVVMKWDTSGNYVWSAPLKSMSIYTQAWALAADNLGNVYTIGNMGGPLDLDPGPDTFYLSPDGLTSTGFMQKLDPSGNFCWAYKLDGDIAIALAVASDGNGGIHSAGYYAGTVDFDPNLGVYSQTETGNGDAFVLKVSSTSSSPLLTSISTPLTIYPNPSEGLISIAAKKKIGKLSVTDVLGRTVLKATPDAAFYNVKLDVPGVYLLSAEYIDGQRTTQRFVIN